uniref:HTH CENPB-type domain-containing protein n=1 Tax=Biomphalaria glabrata TaxID=6526 RepID=A0A2C9JXP0_BIOGL
MSNITPKSGKHGSRKTHEVGAIIAAIEEIKSGSISIRKAAAKFEIPISTLHNKLKGKSTLEASRMLLTNDEESKLVNWLIELSRCGFGKTNDEVKLAARDIMATRNAASKSKNKVPTNNWLYKFYKRHPELSLSPHMSLAKERKMSNLTPKSGKHGSRKTHEAGALPAKERKMSNITPKSGKHGSRKTHEVGAIIAAIEEIKSGSISYRKAAEKFEIPTSTLHNKLKGKSTLESSRMLLTKDEESKLVNWLIELSRCGFGKTNDEIRLAARDIMATRNAASKSKSKVPTNNWLYKFYERHPELSLRSSTSLAKERAVITPEDVSRWFSDLKHTIDAIDNTVLKNPHRIFSANETGFGFNVNNRKVIEFKQSKHMYSISSNNKTRVTVLACASAGGQYIPPLLIYPYKRMPSKNLLEEFPDAHLQVSDKGRINASIFYTWLRDSFIPATQNVPKPVILLVDGHTSHTSLTETSLLCDENKILLYCLLPHASHLIQPLDQAFFGAIKPAWIEAIRQHGVSLKSFASILAPIWRKNATPDIAAKSFSAAGIYPYNPEKVLKSGKMYPSKVYRNTDQNPSLSIPANTVTSLATDISVPPEASSSMVPLESSTPTEASQTEISYNFDTSTFPVIAMTIETPAEASIMSEASDDLWTIPLAIPTQPEASSLLLTTPQHRTSTKGLPPQIPSTSKVSSPRKMSTKQLKAHKDLCFFLADEISRHQLIMFFSKLSGSQSQDLSDAKDVSQYQKFLDLSHTLFAACDKSEGQAVTASITANNIFKLPSLKGKSKGNRNPTLTTTVPNLISGDEFRGVSKRKHQGIEETENKKIGKRLERVEIKKKREQEKDNRKLVQEEKKEEQEKKEGRTRKKLAKMRKLEVQQ